MTKARPYLVSGVVFLAICGAGGALIRLLERQRLVEAHAALSTIGVGQAQTLQRQLDRALSATLALASLLKQSGDMRIKDFTSICASMIETYGGISCLQLAPDGVVSQIYPLEGNEQAIGHDLLNDPSRRTEALATIESRALTLAGPMQLIQGGTAVIGRYPVFIPDENGIERFWGFTISLISMSHLLAASGLVDLVEGGYDYELSRFDADRRERAVFADSGGSMLNRPLEFLVKVPNAVWTLSITPQRGWRRSSSLISEIGLVGLVAGLAGFITFVLAGAPDRMRRDVEARTADLRESESRFRQLAENVYDALWLISADERELYYVNTAYETISGRSCESLYANPRSWLNVLHPEDRQRINLDMDTESACYEGERNRECRVVGSDGEVRWVWIRSRPVYNEAGTFVARAGVAVDITERKRAEDQVRQTQAELAHIGRVAAVGELATGIAHELKQPLGAIVNYSAVGADWLASADVDRDDLIEALCEIAKEAERAGQIIQRLRRFIRRGELKRSTVFLKTMVDDMIALVMNELRHAGVRLRVEVPDDLTVVADPVQLQQVILNLVCNAMEAMAEAADGTRELTITASAGRGMVQVAVDDTGPGFDAEAKERVFEQFFSTKQEGLGMGLTISRRIIEAHGGRIWTEGDRDRGARILFTLPVRAE